VLLALPPLFLLHQAARLGTAARERRFAALRVAGATPSDVRRLGAIEVGIPALGGSVLGLVVFALLRLVLGGTPLGQPQAGIAVLGAQLRLVPSSVTPSWWEATLVVVGATTLGVVVGLRASDRVMAAPLGVVRRQSPPPPRPWGLGLVAAAAGLFAAAVASGARSPLIPMALIALALVGVLSLSGGVAQRIGRLVESRATSGALLLASRRIVADPRPVGRAAAVVGAVALVAGGAGAVVADVVELSPSGVDPFYTVSLGLVGVVLLAALVVAAGALGVHAVESLVERKGSIAALAALGMPSADLERSQRLEAMLVAMPVAALGVLLGAVPMGIFVQPSAEGVIILLVTVVATLALVATALLIAVGLTRPALRRAAAPDSLRTE
jgi:hypothetical protein